MNLSNISERIDDIENITIYNLDSNVTVNNDQIEELKRLYDCIENAISFLNDLVWEIKQKQEKNKQGSNVDSLKEDIKKIKNHIGIK